MKVLLLRSLNKNQIFLLNEINEKDTISRLVNNIYRKQKISVSTLKLNAKILKKLGLIEFGNGDAAGTTGFGKFVLKVLKIGAHEDRECADIKKIGTHEGIGESANINEIRAGRNCRANIKGGVG